MLLSCKDTLGFSPSFPFTTHGSSFFPWGKEKERDKENGVGLAMDLGNTRLFLRLIW